MFCVYFTVAERAQRAANRKNTCKWRKQLPQFYNAHAANAHNTTKKKRAANKKKHLQIKKTLSSIWQPTRCRCSQHNQKRNVLQIKCIWLCCEHLQCVSLFGCVVSICPICCQNEMFFWFAGAFSICMFFLKLHTSYANTYVFVCVVSICPICCQNENVFLDLLVLFLFACFFWSCILHMQNTYVFDSFDAPEAQSAL